MKKYADGGMTPAQLAAERLNKGKTMDQLLKEDKERDIKKKMDAMPPQQPVPIGEPRPGVGKSAEDQMMDQATERGYDYTKKRPFKAGGSVASKRADGCAVRGKTRGKMV